jgi:rubrerythrin
MLHRPDTDFPATVRTAIEYETKMRDAYLEAVRATGDPTRREIFLKLATDEENHMELMRKCLGEWLESGTITAKQLRAAASDKEAIHVTLTRVREALAPAPLENELQMLQKAYAAETEACDFFARIVEKLRNRDQKELFENVLLAEQAHVSIVKSELDYAMSGQKSSWVVSSEDDRE